MTEGRSAYLRVQQHYGELLADFHRKQADIAAEQDAKLAAWCGPNPTGHSEPTPLAPLNPVTVDPGAFDEDDFSNNTWLR